MRRYTQAGAVFSQALGNLADVRARHVVTGAPTISDSPLGKAMRLDGAADYVTLGAAWEEKLRFNAGTQDFSIAIWLRVVSASEAWIFSKLDAASDGWGVYIDADGIVYGVVDARQPTGPVGITDAIWHHVCFTVDRSGNGVVYLDGVAGTGVAMGGEVMATTTTPRIGARSYAVANYFNGEIKGVTVIDRILTPTEVADLASGTAYDYERSCAHRYDMSDPIGLPDLGVVGGNPGTGALIVSNPPGIGGICAEFDGNNSNYNLGNVAMLNAVSAFTIAFWMNQDVLDTLDYIFTKEVDTSHELMIWIHAAGNFIVDIDDVAGSQNYFDYSTVYSAGEWAHVTVVFDGSQADNSTRLVIYFDGVPVTLTHTGTVPALTPDLPAADVHIGRTSSSFAGRLDDFRIYSTALTQLQVADLHARSRQGRTGG